MELADNQLTKIEFISQNFPSLERLQLSRNKIVNIDTISRLSLLTKLNLRDNKIITLPD
jgi:Leucine-rich repeat (LRR) protein